MCGKGEIDTRALRMQIGVLFTWNKKSTSYLYTLKNYTVSIFTLEMCFNSFFAYWRSWKQPVEWPRIHLICSSSIEAMTKLKEKYR